MGSDKNYFPVNALAQKDERMTVFFKGVVGKKSDGFAVVNDGKVFVIDIGKEGDTEYIKIGGIKYNKTK